MAKKNAGVKHANEILVEDKDGNTVPVIADNGAINVKVVDGAAASGDEVVLLSDTMTVSGTATIELPEHKKLTSIDVANYEDSAMVINGINVGPKIAISLPASNVTSPLTVTGDGKVYIAVKGVV